VPLISPLKRSMTSGQQKPSTTKAGDIRKISFPKEKDES